jgi:hypothetical protein
VRKYIFLGKWIFILLFHYEFLLRSADIGKKTGCSEWNSQWQKSIKYKKKQDVWNENSRVFRRKTAGYSSLSWDLLILEILWSDMLVLQLEMGKVVLVSVPLGPWPKFFSHRDWDQKWLVPLMSTYSLKIALIFTTLILVKAQKKTNHFYWLLNLVFSKSRA